MKKVITITASALVLYTIAALLCFAFIAKALDSKNKNSNYFWERSYSYIDYADDEKAVILSDLSINLETLASQGFKLMGEKYMMPSSWKKELHIIELSFENIYCTVTINVHEEEIGWERNREHIQSNITYTSIEIDGREFDRNNDTLRYDDTERGVLFLFQCSLEPDSVLYKEFLQAFFEVEGA